MAGNKHSLKILERDGRIPRSAIAAAVNAIHVLPVADDGWTVHVIGNASQAPQFSSQEDALAYARSLVRPKPAQIVVHDRNGRISNRTA